jgi:hypothetical protein
MTERKSLLEYIQIVLYKHNAVTYQAKYDEAAYQEASKFIQGYRWAEPTVGPVQESVKALLEAARDLDLPKRVEWCGYVFVWRYGCYQIERLSGKYVGSERTIEDCKKCLLARALASRNEAQYELEMMEAAK